MRQIPAHRIHPNRVSSSVQEERLTILQFKLLIVTNIENRLILFALNTCFWRLSSSWLLLPFPSSYSSLAQTTLVHSACLHSWYYLDLCLTVSGEVCLPFPIWKNKPTSVSLSICLQHLMGCYLGEMGGLQTHGHPHFTRVGTHPLPISTHQMRIYTTGSPFPSSPP